METKADSDPRIGIIGAGPAGLSVAHFLKENGYKDITILETADRVGGKCQSLTVDGKSFDLGANYITSSYKEVTKLAKKVGAGMYTEGRVHAYDTNRQQFRSVFKIVLQHSNLFVLGIQSIRFIWKRWRLNKIISRNYPGFQRAGAVPELCDSFESWLETNKLSALSPLFEIPITQMGYGQLTSIPAAYALAYMTAPSFIDLVCASITPRLLGFPKRFTEGFQRFWERVSWTFDTNTVLLNTTAERVHRSEKISVSYVTRGPGSPPEHGTMVCDVLFVCVPPLPEILSRLIPEMSSHEKGLFGQVTYDPFIITTYKVQDCQPFTAGTFVLPEPPMGQPFVVNRQFDDVDYLTFYNRWPYGETVNPEAIREANQAFLKSSVGKELPAHFTYNNFVYFPQVDSAAMAGGFYDGIENLQGEHNTFYVSGLMNFELVENIMVYAKALVNAHFPPRR